MITCRDCGIEGIHACLGKPINKENLPEGVRVFNSGELMGKFKKNLISTTSSSYHNKESSK